MILWNQLQRCQAVNTSEFPVCLDERLYCRYSTGSLTPVSCYLNRWSSGETCKERTVLLGEEEMHYSRVWHRGCSCFQTYLKAILPFTNILTGGKRKEGNESQWLKAHFLWRPSSSRECKFHRIVQMSYLVTNLRVIMHDQILTSLFMHEEMKPFPLKHD